MLGGFRGGSNALKEAFLGGGGCEDGARLDATFALG